MKEVAAISEGYNAADPSAWTACLAGFLKMGRGALQADELEILKELPHHQNIVRFFSSWSALSWATR